MQPSKKITSSKPIPHIPLPFKEVIADVLKVKPPEKTKQRQGNERLVNNADLREGSQLVAHQHVTYVQNGRDGHSYPCDEAGQVDGKRDISRIFHFSCLLVPESVLLAFCQSGKLLRRA